jgi:putative transcriptional regulator
LLTAILILILLPDDGWLNAATISATPSYPGRVTEPEAGKFLVARRDLHGPYFRRTVIYLLQHDETGTLGLVVNRPIDYKAADVLPTLEGTRVGSYRLYNGGPVGEHIMIMLLRGIADTEPALKVIDGVYASSDADLLERMVAREKPATELRLFIGHAGWLPGQLERELRENSWFVTDGDPVAVFSGNVSELWRNLIERLDPPGIMVRR